MFSNNGDDSDDGDDKTHSLSVERKRTFMNEVKLWHEKLSKPQKWNGEG